MRWLVLATLVTLSMGGCGDDRDDDIYVHRVDRRHVCTRSCNHHFYDGGGKLVVIKDHRHGANCGHRWDGRRWVILRTQNRPILNRPHVCTRGCSHFYDGKRLVALKGHRHGANCGHRWDGNRWVILRTGGGSTVIASGHRCGRSCNNHFFDGRRVVALKGHRHSLRCGHRWNGRYWVAATNSPTKRRIIRRR